MRLLTLLLCFFTLSVAPARADDADDQYRFVVALCEQGNHALAVREARKFLEEHPEHPRADLARYRLASSLFELEREAEAAPLFRALAEREGFDYRAESWLRLGQCKLRADHLEAAKDALTQARSSDQTYLYPAAAFFLGECHLALGEHAEAKRRYEETLSAKPETEYHAHALRGRAWCESELDEATAAARTARAFLARFADHALADEVRFLLGEAELAGGAPARAEAAWAEVGEGAFRDAALRGRAFARSALGDLEGAARLFGELLELAPEGRFAAEAALQRGAHLLRASRSAEALAALSSPAAGDAPEVLYWLGQAQAACGDGERALRTLERAARGAPEELRARISVARGDVLFELGRLEESAAAYGDADGGEYALHAAATALLRVRDEERAVATARTLLERYPNSPYAATTALVLAEGLFALGEHDEARARFRVLLDEEAALGEEDLARARSRIAWCTYLLGDARAARRAFAEVCTRHPASLEAEDARFMEGRCALETDDGERAAAAFTRYLEEREGGAHRAEVRLELSRLQSGTEQLEALLAESGNDPLVPRALLELAEKHAGAGDHARAIARYRELLERFPASETVPSARYGLAWQLRTSGAPGDALEPLAALLAAPPLPEPELLLAALQLAIWCASEAERIEECVAAWSAFEPRCDDQAARLAAGRVVARALAKAGRGERAQVLVTELAGGLSSPEPEARAYVEGAWLALQAGEIDVAERGVLEALRAAPENAEALEAAFFVGEARFEAGSLERAEPLYRAATSAHTGERLRDDALYKLGFTRLRLERWREAAEVFEELVQDFARSELFGESLYLAGECRFRAGELERAVAHLERVRAELPRHEIRARALFRLGLASYELGALEACERALTELVKQQADFPNRAEAELCLGRALAARGKARAARSAFDAVLRTDRGVLAARARIEIGRLHFAAGEHEDALSEFLKVALLYAHEDEVAEAMLLAGHCLEAQGERELAVQQYEQLVQKHPRSPFAREAKERLKRLRIR